MCGVRGLLSGRFGQRAGITVGRGEADSFVFSVSANEKKKKKSEMLVDSAGRLT